MKKGQGPVVEVRQCAEGAYQCMSVASCEITCKKGMRNKIRAFYNCGRTFTTGQGLLETIVAIGIMMTGLISVMSLVVSNLNSEREAATRYQAVNLAREGIELMRNTRDSNWLSGNEAWAGIAAASRQALPEPFENFTREIGVKALSCVESFPAPDPFCGNIEHDDPIAQEITATVRWNFGGRERTITLTDTLYDWK